MARKAANEVIEAEVTEVIEAEAADTKEEENTHKLSSGVVIRFNGTLPPEIVKATFTALFQNANLNSDGTINENVSPNEQLELSALMMEYNSSLLSEGVVELVNGLPIDMKWLKRLKRNPVIRRNHPDIDFNDADDQVFLYLRYIAFASDEDWALLSTELVNL